MYRFVTALSVLLVALPVFAGTFDSGSDGTDLALDCAALMALPGKETTGNTWAMLSED